MSTDQQTRDRAVQAILDGWGGADITTLEDVESAVRLVLRVVRDDYVIATQRAALMYDPAIETWLERRIEALGGRTMTGDTTTPGFAGFEAADERGDASV